MNNVRLRTEQLNVLSAAGPHIVSCIDCGVYIVWRRNTEFSNGIVFLSVVFVGVCVLLSVISMSMSSVFSSGTDENAAGSLARDVDESNLLFELRSFEMASEALELSID